MPAACTIAGADVLDCRIELPQERRWTAEATLATGTAPTGAVTIDCDGGLALSGTVVRSRVYLDACTVWIVGGANGLGTHVVCSWNSCLARDVLSEITRTCGETLDASIASDLLSLPLARWSCAGTGAASLDALAAEASRVIGERIRWRFTTAGKLWLGRETWSAQTLPAHAQVLDEEPGRRVAIVGAEVPTVEPGRDVAGVGRVVHVEHLIRADEVRSRCYLEQDALAAFRRAVRGAVGLRAEDTAELWRGMRWDAQVEQAAADGSTVDVRPLSPLLSRISGVRLRQPFPGSVVVCQPGAIVEIGWQGGNAGEIYAVPSWASGSTSKIVLNATMVYAGAEAGADKVTRKSDHDGHTHPHGGMTGTITGTANLTTGAVTGTCVLTGGDTGGAAAIPGTSNFKAK